jgi:hypothetical protein
MLGLAWRPPQNRKTATAIPGTNINHSLLLVYTLLTTINITIFQTTNQILKSRFFAGSIPMFDQVCVV